MTKRLAWTHHLFVLMLIAISGIGSAGAACPDSTLDGTAYSEQFTKSIQATNSCKAAVDQYKACMMGSTIDLEPGDAAIKKCEADFLDKLSESERSAYMSEGRTCTQSAEGGGTLGMSEARTCQVDLAQTYSQKHGGKAGR